MISTGASAAQIEDTIVAVASAPGRGAIALVRLSGPDAFSIAAKHLPSWPPEARASHLCDVFDRDQKLDQALVTLFPGPNSFTGDDTVEISTHGGYLVPSTIVAALISSGARQATPGEFTRRAVLNGKLDIVQAEAIGDLIDASSHVMQRTALGQLDGGLSRRLLGLRNDLIGLEALIAYDVDFPEEDDGPVPRKKIDQTAEGIGRSLDGLLATAPAGEVIREGAIVVIAGPPNVGKSSLFNALLGRSRAIVTEIPGTTRDALEAVIDSGKWPLRLVDTAGLRETEDRIELLGIEVSERYLANAHVVLACAENSKSLGETTSLVARSSTAPILAVRTKSDLVSERDELAPASVAIRVSAETGAGLQELLGAIDDTLDTSHGEIAPDLPILTRARHRKAISTARSELEQFTHAWREEKLPATVAAVHLRTAVCALEELIGTVEVEDVLDRVFSSFCVGK
ncbi:MAG TPA: tRNA uridine-5-carboxymethylaminomethyl(34) synthesis GTPase MnmE [Gemmatimonadaceae bacterium]|nr:tRNA uridine-5-carboxymethylaminomethyl(34) synthesis GTPase MnmE [Gemmatimonadaceae bacterium]